jgi:membrane protein implicated in regulation of membrane protease activity
MHLAGWELWIGAALLLLGGELMQGSLVLLAMALACVPAAIGSLLGAGLVFQLLLFAGFLLVEFPLLVRISRRRRSKRLVTNADAIVGKRVKILQLVSEKADGVVLLSGEHWKARSVAGELAPGSEAQIVERDGLCLLVVPFER